jgi:protease I
MIARATVPHVAGHRAHTPEATEELPMSRIAFVVGEDFEDSELMKPLEALREAGHDIDLLGVKAGEKIKGKNGTEITLDASVTDKDAKSYDALVIPGGYSPDHLRMDKDVVRFVGSAVHAGKVIAAVCHGPQLLIEADAVEDKQLTSWPSVRTDLLNAGAKWVDREVVIDGTLITSRKPADLPAFIAAIRDQLGAREHRKAG